MKRILLAAVGLTAAGGAAYRTYPEQFERAAEAAGATARRAGGGVADNPGPVALALGTFLLTVGYHKARGKTLRESVEVAATRVTVVPAGPVENAVVQRAKARATRAQLLADQVGVQNRLRKLPEEIVRAEKEACYAEQAVADAERALATKQKALDEAVSKLDALRDERATGMTEVAEIETELKKLSDVI